MELNFSVRLSKYLLLIILIGVLSVSCESLPPEPEEMILPAQIVTYTTTKNQVIPSPSLTLIISTETAIPPSTTHPPEPRECRQPSGNYDRTEINGHLLNMRTLEMLTYAAELYGGKIDITGSAITQGSYTTAVAESFGTHAGGGAVDLSVFAPGTYTILYDDIELLIRALRLAGFAAWYRDFNDLYEGSPVHIHAIAIGDRELSLPAREQLAGPHGYFWGYDGLPVDEGTPNRDPHGGPLVCEWMIAKGYPNKTATPSPADDLD